MPNFGDWTYWLLAIGVAAVMVALIYTAWWALFSDRNRSRRRCPRCWYDMAYSPGMTCAECGYTGTEESNFHKTRRRPRLAAASITACAALALYVNDRVNQQGYASMLPTRVLFWMLPFSSDPNGDAFAELIARAGSNRLNQKQWAELVSKAAAGDWWAKPIDDRWRLKYGTFITNWRGTFINDAALEAPLSALPMRIEATSRETWPADAAAVINVRVTDWWPAGYACRIRATPRLPGAGTITFQRTGEDFSPLPAYPLFLPALDPTASEVVIDFEIERRRVERVGRTTIKTPDAQWQPVSRQTVTVQTKVEGKLDQLTHPADEAGMAEAVAQVFSAGATRWSTGPSPVRFNIDLGSSIVPALADTAVGVSVELMRDDQVARRLNVWWIAGTSTDASLDRHYGFEINLEDLELLKQLDPEDDRWRLRIRGDPALALRAGKAAKFWSGQTSVPLRLRVADEADLPPARAWWTETE